MPVTDAYVGLPNDGPGKKEDHSQVTTSSGTVLRERINIADPVNNNYANVTAAGAIQVDGSAVTQPDNLTQIGGNAVLSAGQNGVLPVGGAQLDGGVIAGAAYPVLIAGTDGLGTPHVRTALVDANRTLHVTTDLKLDPGLGSSVAITSATPTGPVAGSQFACDGYGNVLLQLVITGGTITSGNVALEGSIDSGTTWETLKLIFEDSTNGTFFTNSTAPAKGAIDFAVTGTPEFYRGFIAGYKLLRFNVYTALTGAGTATITPQLVICDQPIYVTTQDASVAFEGTSNRSFIFLQAGGVYDGDSTSHELRLDANNNLKVSMASPGIGAGTLATNQVSVGTSATQIVAARAARVGITITNLGTTDVYLGTSGVTTGTGDLLAGTKGASVFIPTSAAVYGIVGSGTQSVSYMEIY